MSLDMCEYGVGVKDCLAYYQDENPEWAKNLEERIANSKVKYSKKEVKKAKNKLQFVNFTPLNSTNIHLSML